MSKIRRKSDLILVKNQTKNGPTFGIIEAPVPELKNTPKFLFFFCQKKISQRKFLAKIQGSEKFKEKIVFKNISVKKNLVPKTCSQNLFQVKIKSNFWMKIVCSIKS